MSIFSLLYLAGIIAYVPYVYITAKQRRWWATAICLIAVMYPLGKLIQAMPQVPQIFRWYLSDFAWNFFLASFGSVSFSRKTRMSLLSGGLLAATVTELLQFSWGAGDPIDMILFWATARFAFTLLLLDDGPKPVTRPAEVTDAT